MKYFSTPLLLALSTFLMMGCSAESKPLSSKTIVNTSHLESEVQPTLVKPQAPWIGTYQAVVPCDSCDDLLIELTLNQDSSYYLSEKYITNDEHHQPLDAVGLFKEDPHQSNHLMLDGAADHRTIILYKDGLTLSSRSKDTKFTLLKTS